MSIAITSSNIILFSLFGCTTNHIVSTVKQLAADDILFFIAQNAKTLAGELNSVLKANLNGHPSICQLIQI